MDPSQRFKTWTDACPVCGGHPGLPQGEGRRCYGFISDKEGLYAHCTREERAGHLDRNGNSNTYAHRLKGDCGCREVHGAGPARARRFPENGQGAPSVDSYRDLRAGTAVSAMGLPVRRRGAGGLHGEVGQAGRRQGNPPPGSVRMGAGVRRAYPSFDLYTTCEALWERPDAPVLVVEGEKTSDAARKLFSSYVPTTSMSGAKAAHLSDWAPLKGREVVVWPDNDPDGSAICAKRLRPWSKRRARQRPGSCGCPKACPPIGT